MKVTAIVLLLIGTTGTSTAAPTEAFCFPNGTMSVANPDPLRFVKVYAFLDVTRHDVACQAVLTEDRQQAYITNCSERALDIYVLFAKDTERLDSDLLQDAVFIVSCIGTRHGPATQTTEGPQDLMFLPPHVPIDTVKCDIVLGQRSISSAYIGETLSFAIFDSGDYDLKPINCFSCPGFGIQPESCWTTMVTSDSCTTDMSLFSSFYAPHNGDQSLIVADMHVYGYVDSNYVTVWCNVRVCQKNDRRCDLCSSLKNAVSVVDAKGNITRVSRSFRVLDPAKYPYFAPFEWSPVNCATKLCMHGLLWMAHLVIFCWLQRK